MLQYEFKDEKLSKEYQKKKEKLLQLVKDPVIDTTYLWDKTVQKYAVSMEKVKCVLTSEGMKQYDVERILENINSFLTRCGNAEFHIALVGAIKAGKSTLINALLGYEYASTKVTPETAALTKFRKSGKNYVKVTFYSKNEWQKVWDSANRSKATVFLEEYSNLKADDEKEKWIGIGEYEEICEDKDKLAMTIEKWTSSKSPVHYFVKEVEVGLQEFGLPEGVVLVDTPGLDDIVEYRSDITKSYIQRANAVLVCVKSDALTGQEMATIYGVFSNARYNPEKIYIIATQIDTLNRPVENWKMQREEWLKHLKGRGAYGSLELASKNLIEVSSYLYMLLQQYSSLDKDDDRIWDLTSILSKMKIREEELVQNQNIFKNLMDYTNIEYLRRKIDEEIVKKHKEILISDIKNSYEICKGEILDFVRKKKENQIKFLEASQNSADIIEKQYQEISQKCKEAEEDKKELETIVKRFQILAEKRAEELERTIKSLGRK